MTLSEARELLKTINALVGMATTWQPKTLVINHELLWTLSLVPGFWDLPYVKTEIGSSARIWNRFTTDSGLVLEVKPSGLEFFFRLEG